MEGVTAIVKTHDQAEKSVSVRKDMEAAHKKLDATIAKNEATNKAEHTTFN